MNVNDSLTQVHAIRAQMETDPEFKTAMLEGMNFKALSTPKPRGLKWWLFHKILFFPVAVLYAMGWFLKQGLLNTFLFFTFMVQIILRCSCGILIFVGLFFALLVWAKMGIAHLKISTPEWWAIARFEGQLILWFLGILAVDASIFVTQTALGCWFYGISKT